MSGGSEDETTISTIQLTHGKVVIGLAVSAGSYDLILQQGESRGQLLEAFAKIFSRLGTALQASAAIRLIWLSIFFPFAISSVVTSPPGSI